MADRAGAGIAALLVFLAAMVVGHRLRRAPGRTVAVAVAAASAVSAGFALAITLRNHAVAHHPLAGRTGQTVSVVMTPSESPREISSGRVLLKGPLVSVGDTEIGGLVTVFAPSADYGQVGVGQPVGFRARVGKPDRRDLSVAVLIATGLLTLGRAPRCNGWPNAYARGSRPRRRCCPMAPPRSCPA